MFMHLTNYALNKDNEDFHAAKDMDDDSGHKRSLKTVLKRLQSEGNDIDGL